MVKRRNQNEGKFIFSRKTTRLPGYDYSQPGMYFVTVCTHRRRCCLGEVVDGEKRLTRLGKIVREEWKNLSRHYINVNLDEIIVMPDHIHGIVQIMETNQICGRGGFRNPPLRPRHDLSEIVRGFKTWSARRINQIQGEAGGRFWQRSFYDHIIRDENDLENIRRYIRYNDQKWERYRD